MGGAEQCEGNTGGMITSHTHTMISHTYYPTLVVPLDATTHPSVRNTTASRAGQSGTTRSSCTTTEEHDVRDR